MWCDRLNRKMSSALQIPNSRRSPAGLAVFRRNNRVQIDWYHNGWPVVAGILIVAVALQVAAAVFAGTSHPWAAIVSMTSGLAVLATLARPSFGHGWNSLEIDGEQIRLWRRFPFTRSHRIELDDLQAVSLVQGERTGLQLTGWREKLWCPMSADQAQWSHYQITRFLADSPQRVA